MEEILQSIKRIIAEENDGSTEAGAVNGSDVLELTDLVDTAEPFDTFGKKETAIAAAVPEPVKTPTEAPKAVLPPQTFDEPPAFKEESELLVAMPISKPTTESTKDVLKDIDSLLSDETRKASSAMIKSLSESKKPTPSPVVNAAPPLEFRSGQTVEDLVIEALKPMLKGWLDANLLQLVEKLVQKEISKINS